MAVRFIIGRAGSGKTFHCLEAIRSRLRVDPVDGPRLMFLVPEQASQQMERAILLPRGASGSEGAVAASHRAEVFSFQRLADRVLESTAAPIRTTLSESARVMVLRYLLARHGPKLAYYQRVERFSGFFERLSATIVELIQEGVTPADLAASIGDAGVTSSSGRDADPAHAAKMHDIVLIYSAYLEFLGVDRLDPSQHLELSRECLARCEWLHGAELWVDGFASLSGQEAMTLGALAKLCSHVEIAVLLDPSQTDVSLGRGGSKPRAGAARLFKRTYRTYQDMRRMFQVAGIAEEEPLILSPTHAPRFSRNKSLAELERRLFADIPRERESGGAQRESVPQVWRPGLPGGDASGGVALVELPSRRVEVEYAVACICEWTRLPAPRYRLRDIALIVRDLEPYHDLISEALDARGIPYFIDRRRPITHHPLVELLRAGFAIAVEAVSLESVRLLLKTGLTPLSGEECDELENYLLAHGIHGEEAWSGVDWTYRRLATFDAPEEKASTNERTLNERVNEARRCLVDPLSDWLKFANDAGGHEGANWAEGVRRWLGRMGVAASLRRWADEAEERGELDQAEEHRQVWSDVNEFLDDLAAAFGDLRLTVDELAAVLEAGLGGLTLGLVPPTVDQVLVGSIERSRHPDIKAAIILGFNDGVFPARAVEDTILNDDDREALSEAKLRIGAPARQRALDESMLVYIAMTRASDELVVTYARANDDGGALRASPYVEALRTAWPGLEVRAAADPTRDRSLWDIQTASDLRRRLAMEFRSRPPRSDDVGEVRAQWNELYESVRVELGRDALTGLSWSSLGDREEAALSPATVERLYPGTLRTSVSKLERYAECPFKYLAEHVLRLRQRAEAEIAAVDVGTVHHAILEDFAKGMVSRQEGFAGRTESELLTGLAESCERVATRLPPSGELADARNAYVLRRSAARLARVVQAQRRANQSGKIRPQAAELSFGMGEENGLPALELSTPAGRRVTLRGYIDRVDLVEAADELLGVVIDYKDTRNKRLDMSRAYHGLSLQLLAYLLVLAEKGETPAGRPIRRIRPAGALYLSLAPQYHPVKHPGQAETRDTSQGGTFRARGLLHADRLDDLGIESGEGMNGWSPHYAVHRKADGSLGHVDRSDVAEAAAFDAALQGTRTRLGELADGVLNGAIGVRPCRLGGFSPCSWCAMASVCRFEMGLCDVRFLESLKRSEVFRRLTADGSTVE
jgi:ATP-dependent helicase/nuclease subunit B